MFWQWLSTPQLIITYVINFPVYPYVLSIYVKALHTVWRPLQQPDGTGVNYNGFQSHTKSQWAVRAARLTRYNLCFKSSIVFQTQSCLRPLDDAVSPSRFAAQVVKQSVQQYLPSGEHQVSLGSYLPLVWKQIGVTVFDQRGYDVFFFAERTTWSCTDIWYKVLPNRFIYDMLW